MKTDQIQFRNTSLLVEVDPDGTCWVAVKPIILALGINYNSAYESLKNDDILGEVYALRRIDTPENRGQEVGCIPLNYLNGWLFGIQSSRVKPEAKEILRAYKKECYQILFDHFYGAGREVAKSQEDRYELSKELAIVETTIFNAKARKKVLVEKLAEIDNSNWRRMGLLDAKPQPYALFE